MLHLTPATLQGHTVGEGIKDLFLVYSHLFFFFFLFLERKEGEGRFNGNWELVEFSPSNFWMSLFSSQSGKVEAAREQTFIN